MLDELNAMVGQDPSLGILIDEIELQPRNPATYGLNRMFQGLIGHKGEGRMSVFTERERAIDWLNGVSSGT